MCGDEPREGAILRMKTRRLTGALASFIAAAVLAACASTGPSPFQESEAHYDIGMGRMASGDDRAALFELNKAVEENPDNMNAHFALGYIYIRQSKLDQAIVELKKAVALDPKFPDAHNDLGLAYAKKKRYEAAIREFKAASELPLPRSRVTALINMGETYDRMGNTEQAAQSFREALLAQPENGLAMSDLASEYVRMNKPAEAAGWYEKLLRANPGSAGAHYELGKIYFKLGRNADALANFQKAAALAPGTAAAADSEKYIKLLK